MHNQALSRGVFLVSCSHYAARKGGDSTCRACLPLWCHLDSFLCRPQSKLYGMRDGMLVKTRHGVLWMILHDDVSRDIS